MSARAARLIPACAGKTMSDERAYGEEMAHPRVCGENDLAHGGLDLGLGSSPRVRGKPSTTKGMKHHERLIPACAGKTPLSSPTTNARGAHPRVCGENAMPCHWVPLAKGSSPRVRGKR